MREELNEISDFILEIDDSLDNIEYIRCALAIISEGLYLSKSKKDNDMAGTILFIETSLKNQVDDLKEQCKVCRSVLSDFKESSDCANGR